MRSPPREMPYPRLSAGVSSPALYRATNSSIAWGERRLRRLLTAASCFSVGTIGGCSACDCSASLANSPEVGARSTELFECPSTRPTGNIPSRPYSNTRLIRLFILETSYTERLLPRHLDADAVTNLPVNRKHYGERRAISHRCPITCVQLSSQVSSTTGRNVPSVSPRFDRVERCVPMPEPTYW